VLLEALVMCRVGEVLSEGFSPYHPSLQALAPVILDTVQLM
jgi:hypothetical protein